jgi:hypothetical protein
MRPVLKCTDRARVAGQNMRRIGFFVIVMAVALSVHAPAWAEIIDFKTRGKLAHLTPYVGTNNHRAILDDPYVAATLKELTGEYYEKFDNFDLSIAHVELSSPFIILRGSRSRDAFRPEFFLIILINWGNGDIQAAIDIEDGEKVAFSKRNSFREIPSVMPHFLHSRDLLQQLKTPPKENFIWRGPKPPNR